MDIAKLITIVEEFEELYNLKHPHYSNQQRRDQIWDEIGEILNQSGNACKERWTRIRDNHRKALNLRKTKSGQSATKMKPPKYSQELSFLIPYLSDKEEQHSSLSLFGVDSNLDEEQPETKPNVNNTLDESSDTQDSLSPPSVTSTSFAGRKSRFVAAQDPATASVFQEYRSRKEATDNTNDTMTEFFINMANTVKSFPLHEQIRIKAQVFNLINSVEMRLALTSSNGLLPSPLTLDAMMSPVMNETSHTLPFLQAPITKMSP